MESTDQTAEQEQMPVPIAHVNSFLGSVTYRLGTVVVDPGDEQVWHGVTDVLLTHAHFDHIYGLNHLVRQSPQARIWTNEAGREALLDDKKNLSRYHDTPFQFQFPDNISVVGDGDLVTLPSGLAGRVFFTPGHHPSCITWVVADCVFSGDSLIPGFRTVTNLPGGDRAAARDSASLIRSLAASRHLLPGHPPAIDS